MMSTLVKISFLIGLCSSFELGYLTRDQRNALERAYPFFTGRRISNPFPVPLQPLPFTPMELQPVPFLNHMNPMLLQAAINEDSTELEGRSKYFDKFHTPSSNDDPTWVKKLTFGGIEHATRPPVKPSPEWNFRLKFPDMFSHFHKKDFHHGTKEEEDERTDECESVGGKLVLGECYKYFSQEKSYSDARIECQKKGADLWTPDLKNPFLLHFLAIDMPEIAMAPSEELWIGALNVNGKIITVDNEDISEDFLVLPDESDINPEGECVTIEFEEGAIFHNSESCINDYTYICEYKLSSDKHINFHKLVKGG